MGYLNVLHGGYKKVNVFQLGGNTDIFESQQ